MKKFAFFLLVCLCCGNFSADASYDSLRRECKQMMADNPPKIEVDYVFGKLNIDHSKSADELISLSKNINPALAQQHKIQ